jgi:hypothetical protein
MMFMGLTSWPFATAHKLGGGSVGSSFGQPPLRVRDGQPFVGTDTYLRGHILRRQRVPRRAAGGLLAGGLLGGSSSHLSSSGT